MNIVISSMSDIICLCSCLSVMILQHQHHESSWTSRDDPEAPLIGGGAPASDTPPLTRLHVRLRVTCTEPVSSAPQGSVAPGGWTSELTSHTVNIHNVQEMHIHSLNPGSVFRDSPPGLDRPRTRPMERLILKESFRCGLWGTGQH